MGTEALEKKSMSNTDKINISDRTCEIKATGINGQSTPIKHRSTNCFNENNNTEINELKNDKTACANCLCNLCICGNHDCADGRSIKNNKTSFKVAPSAELIKPCEKNTEYSLKYPAPFTSQLNRVEKIVLKDNEDLVTGDKSFESKNNYDMTFSSPDKEDYCVSRVTRKSKGLKNGSNIFDGKDEKVEKSHYRDNFNYSFTKRPDQYRPSNKTQIIDDTLIKNSSFETSVQKSFRTPNKDSYVKKTKHEN